WSSDVCSSDLKQYRGGFTDRLARLLSHRLVDTAIVFTDTARIDDDKAMFAMRALAILAISGEAGKVRHQRITTARQPIEQRRLANIGTTHQGDYRFQGTFLRIEIRCPANQAAASLQWINAVRGKLAVTAEYIQDIIVNHRRRGKAVGVEEAARNNTPIDGVEPVQVAFAVTGHHQASLNCGAIQVAAVKRFVLPQRCTATLVKAPHPGQLVGNKQREIGRAACRATG